MVVGLVFVVGSLVAASRMEEATIPAIFFFLGLGQMAWGFLRGIFR